MEPALKHTITLEDIQKDPQIHKMCIRDRFFIDGMVKDEVMEKIMEFFYSASEESLADAHAFSKQSIPYVCLLYTSFPHAGNLYRPVFVAFLSAYFGGYFIFLQ